VRIKTSSDGIAWRFAGTIGRGPPSWVSEELGFQPLNLWAPSVSRRGDTYYLYYSASSFGRNVSAIGLATNSAFDPARPSAGWEDQGLVVRSHARDNYNAIDGFRIDTAGGRAWLAFGSYWSGIKMVELDPVSGKRLDEKLHGLASRGGGASEASSILEHEGRFYLFVSFDRCCAGVDSTYRIMVGRADKATGPYAGRNGTSMMAGGGTEVQATSGRFIGPGGQEVFKGPAGEQMLAYHYYDGAERGVSKLQIAPIRWDAEGWPYLDPLPE
jgi:arabinan endo-1,5-alpha-L-arabinosidase